MPDRPVFAVVGHPNKGKSSVVATLSQNDAIAIALEPGTTRRRQRYPLSVDGEVLYVLEDTPGFQRPRRVLEWLEAHSASASDRAQTVAAFVTEHRQDSRYTDECELLQPLIEGAGIIYVVDGSVPYSPEHEIEMTILRWTGRPSLALINSIGPDDYSEVWQAALGQFFQVVRRFDAVRAPFEQHLGLLRAFGQLEPAWETPLERAVRFLSDQRSARQSQAATLIADALVDMMAYREQSTLTEMQLAEGEEGEIEDRLRSRWYERQRQREQALRHDIEHLYQHRRLQRQEAALDWQSSHDLFSEDSRQAWGVSKRYLATAGFGAGAIGGVGLDALTLGTSFGLGALAGGIVGGTSAYLFGDRLALPVMQWGPLQNGLKTATFGPVQDSQFGYVVLGRAVDHWWHISQRNHAGRDLLNLAPASDHWLESLDARSRRVLQRGLDTCRRKGRLEGRQREEFVAVVAAALAAYDQLHSGQTAAV
ncbi:MAG: GTPase/DUF3482 domain-containing protein [Chromatocurvus sp.]